MSDSQLIIQNLLQTDILRRSLTQTAIQAQNLPRGSRGLDAGCGIGQQSICLAQTTGGQVLGLDLDPGQLAYAAGLVRAARMQASIPLCAGDVTHLPLADASLDWIWSADCIGYPAWDLQPVLPELKRVLRPGGSLILLAWSGQQLLPGCMALEARLNIHCSAYAPYLRDYAPAQHFLRAARWLAAAGFEDVRAQTFVGEVQAPLSSEQRQGLLALFEMLWIAPQNEAAEGDWAEFQRLCRPDSPDCILDLPEYYAFFTYTLFRGIAPEA